MAASRQASPGCGERGFTIAWHPRLLRAHGCQAVAAAIDAAQQILPGRPRRLVEVSISRSTGRSGGAGAAARCNSIHLKRSRPERQKHVLTLMRVRINPAPRTAVSIMPNTLIRPRSEGVTTGEVPILPDLRESGWRVANLRSSLDGDPPGLSDAAAAALRQPATAHLIIVPPRLTVRARRRRRAPTPLTCIKLPTPRARCGSATTALPARRSLRVAI